MGVKSTIELTRRQAENGLRRLLTRQLSNIHTCKDSDIAHALMVLNDLAHGGEGYENYQISESAT